MEEKHISQDKESNGEEFISVHKSVYEEMLKCMNSYDLYGIKNFADGKSAGYQEGFRDGKLEVFRVVNSTFKKCNLNFPEDKKLALKEYSDSLITTSATEHSDVSVELQKIIQTAFYEGQQSILNNLPHWQKVSDIINKEHISRYGDGRVTIVKDGYEIALSILDSLPKRN